MKTLPKSVLSKMTTAECKKLETLEAKYEKADEEMVKAQRSATEAFRKIVGKPSAAVQKLINKGFKCEASAFKANDELYKFKEQMKKKY